MTPRFFVVIAFALLAGSLSALSQFSPTADAIIGRWQNAEKDGRFEIFKKDNKYYGKLIWGTGGDSLDVKNPNPSLRKRRVIGLLLLSDFVYEGKGKWVDGTIYDPREGKTYSCKLTLSKPGEMQVRGFVGISLLGRTEVWTRIN
ncbi:MAG: DUF2147 domain-containing protein [Chitinophagaceae bacterium]|jgi:uncharacterized protein (DUF2147 family)|nr:DUF2147 domain-containing protein [Chitinophagaceae bacterium]